MMFIFSSPEASSLLLSVDKLFLTKDLNFFACFFPLVCNKFLPSFLFFRSPSSEPSTSSWEARRRGRARWSSSKNRFTSPLELVSNARLLRGGLMDWLYFALFALCACFRVYNGKVQEPHQPQPEQEGPQVRRPSVRGSTIVKMLPLALGSVSDSIGALDPDPEDSRSRQDKIVIQKRNKFNVWIAWTSFVEF